LKYETSGFYTGVAPNGEYGEQELLASRQSDSRPKIDDVICHYLEGENQKDAFFVIDNIRENKMKIKWSAANTWTVTYKRKHVCDLKISQGMLIIGPVSEVLAIRVKDMSYSRENMKRLVDALRSGVAVPQEAFAIQ